MKQQSFKRANSYGNIKKAMLSIYERNGKKVYWVAFFKNPDGDWKYIVGYEPAFMPVDDFKVYHSVHWNLGDAKAYSPWVNKMTSADRLVIRGGRGEAPNIPRLEWNYGVSGIWVGRWPDPGHQGAPPTVHAMASR